MANGDSSADKPAKARSHFIHEMIEADVRSGKHGGRVVTRFPPEPNGYLHIGHATSINLNFGMAAAFPAGICNLRFDDTNPEAEDVEYVDAIQQDIRWLGFDWSDRCHFASDYFQQLFDFAILLIEKTLQGRLVIPDFASFSDDLAAIYEVTRGDVIAQVGSTGITTAPNLHYEVKVNGVAQDPSGFILPDYVRN